MNDELQAQSAPLARALLAHRDAIVTEWAELIELEESEPAGTFILEQLDASIIAMAAEATGVDPADSSMASRWVRMRPAPDLVAGATVSFGMLPEAIRLGLAGVPDLPMPVDDVVRASRRFAKDIIQRILHNANIDTDAEGWHQYAQQIESYHEEQRVQRVQRLGILIDISHAVSVADNLENLYEHIHTLCTRIRNADYSNISVYNPETHELTNRVVVFQGERRRDLEGRVTASGLGNLVAERQESLHVGDYLAACAQHGFEVRMPINEGEPRAWMAAPMIQQGKTVGVISVSCPLFPFDQEDVELLSAIARQVAIASENRRLLESHQRRATQLRAVNQLARQIVTLRDQPALLNTAVNLIHELFGYGLVSLFLVDESFMRLDLRARSPLPPPTLPEAFSIPVGEGSIIGSVATTLTPILSRDVTADPRYHPVPDVRSTRSEMAVAILRSGQVLGVLDVQSPKVAAFDEHDLTTLSTIADQIAIALENARLFGAEQQRSRELELILRTTRDAGSSLLLDDVLDRLASGIAEAAGVENCMISLFDDELRLVMPAAMVHPLGELAQPYWYWNRPLEVAGNPILHQILAHPHPVLHCQLPETPGSTFDNVCASSLVVPLLAKNRVLGVAVMIGCPSGEVFPEQRIRMIQGVVDSAALAVENARLYAQSQGLAIAEERGRIAQEIHDTLAQGLTAISLQLELADTMLPDNPVKASQTIERALSLSRENLDEARRSVLDLQQGEFHHLSLPDALARLVQDVVKQTGLHIEFESDGVTGRLSARIEVGLYRIIEDALENASHHSDACHARVTLLGNDSEVSVIIEDDGCGYDALEAPHATRGSGGPDLVAACERARMLGGTLEIQSDIDNGTIVQVTVPIETRRSPFSAGAEREGCVD